MATIYWYNNIVPDVLKYYSMMISIIHAWLFRTWGTLQYHREDSQCSWMWSRKATLLFYTGGRYVESDYFIVKDNTTLINFPSVPPRPEKVLVARLDSTTIVVSWTKLTLVELKGLASYVITYDIVIPTRKRQQFRGMTNVSWTENSVFLSNLQPDAQYDITVSLVTSTGTSGISVKSTATLMMQESMSYFTAWSATDSRSCGNS